MVNVSMADLPKVRGGQGDQAAADSPDDPSKPCINKLHTIFSTEGHIFLIDKKLRPLSFPVTTDYSSVTLKTPLNSEKQKLINRRTCQTNPQL